jgi:hypothetical protein
MVERGKGKGKRGLAIDCLANMYIEQGERTRLRGSVHIETAKKTREITSHKERNKSNS